MARKTPPGGPAGPHELPLSEQQHRMVIEGRRLGDCTGRCTIVLIWDPDDRSWVFYLHGSAGMAARFSRADTEAVARHVLDHSARKAS